FGRGAARPPSTSPNPESNTPVTSAAGRAEPFIVAMLILFPALLTNCGHTRCLSHVGTEGSARYRFELDAYYAVCDARSIPDGQRKAPCGAVPRSLCQHIGLARCRIVPEHFPLGRASGVRHRHGPPVRQEARL